MLKACIIGASGYTGVELCNLLFRHPHIELTETFVSSGSADAGKPLAALHPKLNHLPEMTLTALDDARLDLLAEQFDLIFLATPHEASHDWMPRLMSGNAKVLDLSGAFRLKDTATFANAYGFEHTRQALLDNAVYGLADFYADNIANARLVAVPGCYPTASLYALKPLASQNLLDDSLLPVINAVSGVSGAGRKASVTTSFCEVSLQAYGVLAHRHQPEISAYLGQPVIFTPHLGNFKRGILATITVKVKAGVSAADINDAYEHAYSANPLVRRLPTWPKVDDVAHTACCDLHWKLDPHSQYLVIGSAIDNLLKGAAAQALQCANLISGLPVNTGLQELCV